ncbi:MAG: GTPase Era [Acholeplasmatales bacterium]|jgi:GTP-binding protein era|nr:GTPase Era [Acholeplasmatales bacterium]MDD7394658.1 GTPase Era [Acholeplasmatales bacterium]MDY4015985.1 GTPase Era [Bacilli bacterium]HCX08733.1 GTPase Era [Acholeplasmatales bacterium]
MQNKNFKSGFVSIIGRPNVGKSTLLNAILKEKIAIVTPKAQTTRNRIQGIYTTDNEQIIFIDTPGIHKAHNELGNIMNDFALKSITGIDLILYLIDVNVPLGTGDRFIIDALRESKVPTILVANKVDKEQDTNKIVENIETYKEYGNFIGGITISATEGFNIDKLLEMVVSNLEYGPMYYPEDQLIDQPERFVVCELIREKVLLNTSEEIPHSVAVTIDRFKESDKIIDIHATIVVERLSQKKIIIGAKGAMIKKIGTEARKDIKNFLGLPVYLELFVKVEDNWRNKKYQLKEFGYNNDDF